jgi:hypothetical protein
MQNCLFTRAIDLDTFCAIWHNETSEAPIYNFPTILDWWDDLIAGRPKKTQCTTIGHLLYVLWNTWKEPHHRLTYIEVASIGKQDILSSEHAFTTYASAILVGPD